MSSQLVSGCQEVINEILWEGVPAGAPRNLRGLLGSHKADFAAGLSVLGLMVPEAVAYAGIGNMPVSAGLLALLCGLLVFAFAGRSRFAVVSATSSSALVLGTSVAALSAGQDAPPEAIAAVLVIMTGLWLLLAKYLRFGRAAGFVAKPVLRGVTMGLSLFITLSQLPKLLGIHATGGPWEKLLTIASSLPALQWAPAAIGLGALAILFGWRKTRQPVSLWVVVLGIALSVWLPLESHGVELVGKIDLRSSLTLAGLAHVNWLDTIQLSAAICLIIYAESLSSISTLAMKHGDRVNSDRDLLGMGLANLVSGLLGGMAVGAGFSGSMLNESAGAQSRLSTLFAGVMVIFVLAFLLPQISMVPEPVLAAIVIRAVSHGLSPAPLKKYFLWKRDRFITVAAFVSVAALGVLNGLLISVVLSVGLMLYNSAKTSVTELGRLPGSQSYVNRARFPTAIIDPGITALRFNLPLFFANVDETLKTANAMVERIAANRRVTDIVFNMEVSPDLDGTCIEAFAGFAEQWAKRGITVNFARLFPKAKAALQNAGTPAIGAGQLSLISVNHTIRAVEARNAGKDAVG